MIKRVLGILLFTLGALSTFAQVRILSVRKDAIINDSIFNSIADALKVARSGDEINI